jgi:four helix bundle protein
MIMNQEDLVEEGTPVYDLEERTFQFAKRIRKWIKRLPHSVANLEDTKQLVRASGSVGANYIEANEALSKKDFIFRLRICRKEAKESAYWTRLIMESNEVIPDEKEGKALCQESVELKKIFSSIISKSE